MKKLSALLICVCMLVSCGNGGISYNTIEKKKYDIENAVDGKYTVVYTETPAIPDYTSESVGMTKYAPFCWLLCSNEKHCFDFNNNPKHVAMDYVSINISDSDSEYKQEELAYISEFLQENITEQEIVDIFDKCGYDDQYILEIYGYEIIDRKDCMTE